MSGPVFKSKRDDFLDRHNAFVDMALGRMAMAVEVFLKTSAGMPVLYGNMKAQTRGFRNEIGNWRTEVNVEYAAVQELGRRLDGSHVIKNYSTSGTGAGFFARAIDSMTKNRDQYISEASRAVGI